MQRLAPQLLSAVTFAYCTRRANAAARGINEHVQKAALSGNFELLKWALENGCSWNERTCVKAARGGHLDIAKTDVHGIN